MVALHPAQGLDRELQAWYRLDGDFTDSHAGNHGRVIVGTPSWGADRSGRAAGALFLNGELGASLPGIILSGTSFSIQFWTFNPQRWIIGQGESKDDHGLHIGVGVSGMRFDYWSNDLVAPLERTDNWTHWVLTHDLKTETKSIWRDAVCAACKVTTPYLGTGDVTLGRHFTGGGFYIGALDDLAFWRRALTLEEVTALFNKGAPPRAAC